MPLKRKRSNSVVDLTTTSPPLPTPLTTRPLAPRVDSRASSMSARSSQGSKRRQRSPLVTDAEDAPQPDVNEHSHTSSTIMDVDDSSVAAGPSHSYESTPVPPLSPSRIKPHTPPPSNLLSTHTCPICFSAVTNACLTPCGHVICGPCLFAAVKSGIQRTLQRGIPVGRDATAARLCPVCRAILKDWDGRGKGIIPLKIRTVMAL